MASSWRVVGTDVMDVRLSLRSTGEAPRAPKSVFKVIHIYLAISPGAILLTNTDSNPKPLPSGCFLKGWDVPYLRSSWWARLTGHR